jgi:predicted unusual protein kinase regulating ubiquinone biosynthesis (AarF/ABC1/UbiB family)
VSRLTAVVARGLSLPPLVAEMRTRLVEELDYEHEARTQTRFAEAFADDPDVRVPRVVHATSRVLVMEWLDGTPLAAVARDGDQTSRDRAAHLYQRFLVSGPERAGLLHTDPHPGNFRMLPDGRLGVLDFGSSLEMPDGMPPTFGRLIAALLHDDADAGAAPAARGALRQAGRRRRRRQARRLHGAVHGAAPARALPLHPRLAAHASSPG